MRTARRLLFVFFVLCACRARSENSTGEALDKVRYSVVKVAVVAKQPAVAPTAGSPIVQLPDCFHGSRVCILGTGIAVSSNGDVITASHVATASIELRNVLHAEQVDSELVVGISIPNHEDSHGNTFASWTLEVDVEIKAIDTLHDLALLHAAKLPLRRRLGRIDDNVLSSPAWPVPVTLSPVRAKDAEPIFACGFPLGDPDMVTTNGTIGSAWASEIVSTARSSPNAYPIDVYKLDIQLTHGNSGGPIFRLSDQAVLGIVIEGHDNLPGAPPIAVPSKYITEFLTKNNVAWASSKGK